MTSLLRILAFARPYRWRLAGSFALVPFISLFTVGFTAMVKPLADEVMKADPRGLDSAFARAAAKTGLTNYVPLTEDNLFLWVIGGLVAAFVLLSLFEFLAEYGFRGVGIRVVNDLRARLFAHVHEQPVGFFQKHPLGALLSRVMTDVEQVRELVSERLGHFVIEIAKLAAVTAFVVYVDWKMALAVFAAAPLALAPLFIFGRKIRKTSRRTLEEMAAVSDRLKESLAAYRVVKIFGAQKAESGRFAAALDRLTRVNLRAVFLMSLSPPVMGVVGISLLGVLLYFVHGRMPPGTFLMFAVGLYGMYVPVRRIARENAALQRAFAAAERTFELLDMPTERATRPGREDMKGVREGVEFRNVSFAYPGGAPVLRGVSFRAKMGETVALVGASGAGKTTLVNLIPRFEEPTEGAVLVDGRDVREFSLESLRRHVGLVTQDVILFNDTLRANIAYAKPDATESEIRAAAEAAYVDAFASRLPGGYDYVAGETGGLVSGGERQRIAIARVLLKNPPILILDEATSALDPESEAVVQKALQNLVKGRLTFVIAHRLTTVMNADRILVLEGGRIAEEGNHDTLMRTSRRYNALYQTEFSAPAESGG